MSDRIDQLLDEILNFRKDREWEKFHTPRNLAISIRGIIRPVIRHKLNVQRQKLVLIDYICKTG